MASENCIGYPYCVEWTTELPYEGIYRRSSDIFVVGSKWNLELSAECTTYCLYLKAEEPIQKLIRVSSFIYNPSDSNSIVNMSKLKLLDLDCKEFYIGEKSIGAIKDAYPNIFNTGILTIICVFHPEDNPLGKSSAAVSTQTTLNNANEHSLSSDFSNFLKDETFSDVKLKCGDRTFSAHTSILAARSEVFAAMFRNKMAEAEIGVVQIKDVDPEVLEMLFQYMYSGESPDLCEETSHLVYEVADKYAIHGLRRACSNWMVENQTTDNCLDLLGLAEDHSDNELKKAVICFVAEHLADIDVESWSAFKEDYPLLVISILEERYRDSLPDADKTAGKRLLITDTRCNNANKKICT